MHRRFSCDFWANRDERSGNAAEHVGGIDWLSGLPDLNAFIPAENFEPTLLSAVRRDSAGRPICVYEPRGYEPNYAYPLIVWLHGSGGNERDMLGVLPMISEQNYLGVSFRGTSSAHDMLPGAYRWPDPAEDVADFETVLFETVRDVRRDYHVHSERVFVAGFDDGAVMALQLMLRRPEWFGGAICLAGRFPTSPHALARFRDLREKRVLIAAGARDPISPPCHTIDAGRLLHAAGMNVSTRVVDAEHEATPTMLRQIDDWVMDGICTAV
jgi:phospholipase/carboxylesterase